MKIVQRVNKKTGKSFTSKQLTGVEMREMAKLQLEIDLSLKFDGYVEFMATGKISPENIKGKLTKAKKAKLLRSLAIGTARAKAKDPKQIKIKKFSPERFKYVKKAPTNVYTNDYAFNTKYGQLDFNHLKNKF